MRLEALLTTRSWQMIKTFKDRFIDLLRNYYYVGGMPEAVRSYVEEKNYAISTLLEECEDFGSKE